MLARADKEGRRVRAGPVVDLFWTSYRKKSTVDESIGFIRYSPFG